MKKAKMNYKRYYEFLKTMNEPVLLRDVKGRPCDVRAMIRFADEKGITTLELSPDERSKFFK